MDRNRHTAGAGDEQLDRVIGKVGYSLLALNGVIGAGIFGLPAVAAATAGNFSPWLFLLCAAMIMPVVLAFARAASLVRHTGGPVVYVSQAFGSFAGFQVGWLLYISRLIAMAANTVLLVTYLAWFLPALEGGLARQAAIALLIGLLTLINVVGVRAGMLAMHALSVLKLLPLCLLVVVGLVHLNPALLVQGELPPLPSLGETLLLLIYAYVGFENAVIPAGEGVRPQRDIPRAIVFTVLGITVLYCLIQWLAISVLPELAHSERPLVDVAAVLMGTAGATLLAVGAITSIAGNCSASMLGAPRLSYALGLEGSLPAWFGRVSPVFHTPQNSIIFYGVLAIALAVTGSFVALAIMSTLARLLSYAAVIAALPRLQAKSGQTQAMPLPGGSVIPVLGFCLCVFLIAQAALAAWLGAGLFAALGTALYLLSRHQRRAAEAHS